MYVFACAYNFMFVLCKCVYVCMCGVHVLMCIFVSMCIHRYNIMCSIHVTLFIVMHVTY